jgi:hypothetical protein
MTYRRAGVLYGVKVTFFFCYTDIRKGAFVFEMYSFAFKRIYKLMIPVFHYKCGRWGIVFVMCNGMTWVQC